MTFKQVMRIPARFMRGGTSKGVFFSQKDLPPPGRQRDRILLRVMGSPDPYGQQIDGMGGATSSTSKIVVVGETKLKDHDLEYLFGQVALKDKFVDYSGNCGNLTAAVAPFAISQGLIKNVPSNGICKVRMWQQNIAKTIIAHIPVIDGQPQENGDFELDGVTFPAAKINLEFLQPSEAKLFPTGNLTDVLELDGSEYNASLVNAAIPMVFLRASDFGLDGTESQAEVNADTALLDKLAALRAIGALKMGLVKSVEEAKFRQHSPKLALISGPKDYTTSSGKKIAGNDIHILVKAVSMGKIHHAFMGTGAVALGAAAAIRGTIVNDERLSHEDSLKFGHPSGILEVKVAIQQDESGDWVVESAAMDRSARTLMEGTVYVPL